MTDAAPIAAPGAAPEAAPVVAIDGLVKTRRDSERTFTLEVPREHLPAMMPALAAIFAWARQLDLIPEEMAALAAAVRQDVGCRDE